MFEKRTQADVPPAFSVKPMLRRILVETSEPEVDRDLASAA
jgi:hypothetical protein